MQPRRSRAAASTGPLHTTPNTCAAEPRCSKPMEWVKARLREPPAPYLTPASEIRTAALWLCWPTAARRSGFSWCWVQIHWNSICRPTPCIRSNGRRAVLEPGPCTPPGCPSFPQFHRGKGGKIRSANRLREGGKRAGEVRWIPPLRQRAPQGWGARQLWGSIDRPAGLGRANLAHFDGEPVAGGVTAPCLQVEGVARLDLLHRESAEGERLALFEHAIGVVGVNEIGTPMADDGGLALGFEQHGGPLLHSDAPHPRSGGRQRLSARLVQPCQKNQQPAHAVAFDKVCVGDNALQNRDLKKVMHQRHA